MLRDPKKRALSEILARAFKDRRRFQQTRLCIKQADIDHLSFIGVADELGQNVALYTNLAKRVAVVPINPAKVLCSSNAIGTWKILLKQLKLLGKDAYCKSLQKEQSYLTMDPIDDHRDSQELEFDM